MGTIDRIYQNIQACNKHLPKEHLKKLSYVELLRNTHPRDRAYYARQLHREGDISEADMKLFV